MVDSQDAVSVPVLRGRKIYERHLDLLLAEELSCNPAFARFLCCAALGDAIVPGGEPSQVDVVMSNFGDVGVDEGAAGEDDLLVEARWASGEAVRVLVEDKLDAVLQPGQMARYVTRATKHSEVDGVSAAAALLVAPAGYVEGRRTEVGAVRCISIEHVAEWLEHAASGAAADIAARLRWRARHLVIFDEGKSLPSPEVPAMVEVRQRIVDRLAELGSRTRTGQGMRTAGSGWLSFAWPKALIYKVVHGTVDLYLTDLWPDDPSRVESAPAALEQQMSTGRRDDDGFVFTRPDGEPIHPAFFSQSWQRLMSESGLRRIRLHDLRHTHASILAGVPVKVVSERLGRSSPACTMRVYQHVLPGMQADAAAALGDAVFGQ